MDTSQFESLSNNTLLQIQKAQRVLDEAESKMKRFKQQKKHVSIKKLTQQPNYPVPYSNIKQYLAFFLSEQDKHQEIQRKKLNTEVKNRKQSDITSQNYDNELKDKKRTEKTGLNIRYESLMVKNKENQKTIKIDDHYSNFDMKKHTEEQLQKSHLIHLEKIQTFYKQNCQLLDKKLKQLQKNRQKIRKDKVLLLRDNEQLQQKIIKMRKKKEELNQKSNPHAQLIDHLNMEISKLQKKLAKIQLQNNKIIKRKEDLQVNMRICIRNSKQNLQGDLAQLGLVENKSKSIGSSKCPYH